MPSCCPYPSATCCSDGFHCCPTTYPVCNMKRQGCSSGSNDDDDENDDHDDAVRWGRRDDPDFIPWVAEVPAQRRQHTR